MCLLQVHSSRFLSVCTLSVIVRRCWMWWRPQQVWSIASTLFWVVKDLCVMIIITYEILWMPFLKKYILFKSCPTTTIWWTTNIVLWFTIQNYMISITQLKCIWIKTILIYVVSDPNGSFTTLVGYGSFYQARKWKPDWNIMMINGNLFDFNHIFNMRCFYINHIYFTWDIFLIVLILFWFYWI